MSYLEKAKQAENKYKKEELSSRAISAELPEGAESAVERKPDLEHAVRQLEAEILSGQISPTPLLVHGEPLGLVLPLDEVARLLKLGAQRRAG